MRPTAGAADGWHRAVANLTRFRPAGKTSTLRYAVIGGAMLVAGPGAYLFYNFTTDPEFAAAVDASFPSLSSVMDSLGERATEPPPPFATEEIPLSTTMRKELGAMYLLADKQAGALLALRHFQRRATRCPSHAPPQPEACAWRTCWSSPKRLRTTWRPSRESFCKVPRRLVTSRRRERMPGAKPRQQCHCGCGHI